MAVKLPFPSLLGFTLFQINKSGGIYGRILAKVEGVAPDFAPNHCISGNREKGVTIINRQKNSHNLFASEKQPHENFHSWDWLLDLAAISTPEAQERALEMVENWIIDYCFPYPQNLDTEKWSETLTATRLTNFIYAWHPLLALSDIDTSERLEKSLAQHIFHLLILHKKKNSDFTSLYTIKALILCCLTHCLDHSYLSELEEELADFIELYQLPDGGIKNYNPQFSSLMLEHLADLRTAYEDSDYELPGVIQQALDRTAAFIKFLKFSDGRLPHFQGAQNNAGLEIEQLLNKSGFTGSAAVSAPFSGYQKIKAGETEVIMDCAPPPNDDKAQRNYHASIAAFELYVHKTPLIINCGDVNEKDEFWSLAQRSSSAHSTAIIAETNQTELKGDGIGRRIPEVTSAQENSEHGNLISVTHTGYMKKFGYKHHRQLFIKHDGLDIRGLDEFTSEDETPPQNIKIRYHIHPAVQVSLLQSGTTALLRLPNGKGWKLRTQGGKLSLEDSYFCDLGEKKHTKQLVLSTILKTKHTEIKWAFHPEK